MNLVWSKPSMMYFLMSNAFCVPNIPKTTYPTIWKTKSDSLIKTELKYYLYQKCLVTTVYWMHVTSSNSNCYRMNYVPSIHTLESHYNSRLRDQLKDHVLQPKSQLQHGRLWTNNKPLIGRHNPFLSWQPNYWTSFVFNI
jgi:hypothetical protein